MDDEQRRHAEELLRINQRRLHKLEEQTALKGSDTPPHVQIEMEDVRAEVTRLQAELEQGSPSVETGMILPHATLPGGAHRTNLPAPATGLVGRMQEVADVGALLRRADVRVVTLTGPAGVGKTRLSLQVATDLLDEYAEGIWFVDLALVTDIHLVLPTIAKTLGAKEIAGQSVLESLTTYLRDRHLALLLDNFEHIVDAVPLIGQLLAGASGLKLLVTSRDVLHVYGEHEVTVLPLGLPDPSRRHTADQVLQSDAVRLFVARAQAARPDFILSHANASAVVAICTRLDGLPLAIELAAARVKLFPPAALLTRLDSRLKFLTGGARDLPPRQQSLRGALDWSYHLLDLSEQLLFARLGVFVSGCTIEAAEAVCNADSDLLLEVVEGLTALVDKNLLRQEEDVEGEPRFTMLSTICEYAVEQLEMRGEAWAIHQLHSSYFLALAQIAEPELTGSKQAVWLNRLEDEYANLRAVLKWTLGQGDTETSAKFGQALWRFWQVRGHLSEGRHWLNAILKSNADVPAPVRAQLLRGAATLAEMQGDTEQSLALCEESLATYLALSDKAGVAELQHILGNFLLRLADYERAAELFTANLTMYRELGDKRGIARTLDDLGRLAFAQGDVTQAEGLSEASLALQRELGDTRRIANVLIGLGEVARYQGQFDRAAAHYNEALALSYELGYHSGQAVALNNLGYLTLHQGDHVQSRVLFTKSLALYQELADRGGITSCLVGLAGVAVATGQPQRATRLCSSIEVFFNTIGVAMDRSDRADYERYLAAAGDQLNEAAFALAWEEGHAMSLEQAITEALAIGNPN